MFDPLFSRILVAYDGSEPSQRALDLAAKTAAVFKGELVVLTVVPRVALRARNMNTANAPAISRPPAMM